MRTPILPFLCILIALQACSNKTDGMIFGPDPIGQIGSQSAQFNSMSEADRQLLFAYVAEQARKHPNRVVGRRVEDVLADARKQQGSSTAERRSTENRKAAEADLTTLVQALALYRLDTGSLPTQSQGLAALMQRPDDAAAVAKWNGPYLVALPKDLWGGQYRYELDTAARMVRISSLGADGKPGGTGPAEDIVLDAR